MTALTARILFACAALAARLPWPWLRAMADAVASRWERGEGRTARVVRRNLELAQP